jgi:hypothetical protein
LRGLLSSENRRGLVRRHARLRMGRRGLDVRPAP